MIPTILFAALWFLLGIVAMQVRVVYLGRVVSRAAYSRSYYVAPMHIVVRAKDVVKVNRKLVTHWMVSEETQSVIDYQKKLVAEDMGRDMFDQGLIKVDCILHPGFDDVAHTLFEGKLTVLKSREDTP